MARLLITGGAGFIGTNFVLHWLERYAQDRVVVLDALTYAGNRANLADAESHPMLRFVHGDIRDQTLVERLLREEDIDTLVHFAAESHVDRSIGSPGEFIDTNIVGTYRLLEAARAVWLTGSGRPHRYHQVSTDEVYGALSLEAPPFTEDTPYAPNSPYSASKAAADHLVRAYHVTYGLQATVSACGNNYGPYQFPEKLIPLCIGRALTGQPLPIYGDGRYVRDWIYVRDHCAAIERVIKHGRPGARYNLSGGAEVANLDLIRSLCGSLDAAFRSQPELLARYPQCPACNGGTEGLIQFVKDRPGHDRRYAMDARLSEQELGLEPRLPLDAGLARTLDWYLANEAWWRPLMQA